MKIDISLKDAVNERSEKETSSKQGNSDTNTNHQSRVLIYSCLQNKGMNKFDKNANIILETIKYC